MKMISMGLACLMLFPAGLSILNASGTATTHSIPAQIDAMSRTVTLQFGKPCSGNGNESGWQNWIYCGVHWSTLPETLYFRAAVKSNTDEYSLQSLYNDSNVQQSISGHRWYVNSTNGSFKEYFDFGFGPIDAGSNVQTYKIWGNVTTDANNSYYNGTSLVLYIGENSGSNLIAYDDLHGTGGNPRGIEQYYGTLYSTEGYKNVKWRDGSWFMSDSNVEWYWRWKYCWLGGAFEIGWSIAAHDQRYSSQVPDLSLGFLQVTFKFMKAMAKPVAGPAFLDIFPWDSSGDRDPWTLVTVFDNESIYREAAQVYGYEYVVIHERYFNWYTGGGGHQHESTYWTPVNDSIANALTNISGYCHKYGMKFGLYFGNLHGTIWGTVSSWNETAQYVVNQSWVYFHNYWHDKVDFYYFDACILSNYGQMNWSYRIIDMMNPIFENIISHENKPIFYNAYQGQTWWMDNQYLFPVRYEGTTLTNMKIFYKNCSAGDPWAHNLNYSWVSWLDPIFNGEDWWTYNIDTVNQAMNFCYNWGFGVVGTYHFMGGTGFSYHDSKLKNWTGGLSRTMSAPGVSGASGIQENASTMSVWVENSPASIIIHPTLLNMTWGYPMYVSYTSINGTSTRIIIDLQSSNATITDLGSGRVIEMSKIVSWTAESGHRYRIELKGWWLGTNEWLKGSAVVGIMGIIGFIGMILLPALMIKYNRGRDKMGSAVSFIMTETLFVGMFWAAIII